MIAMGMIAANAQTNANPFIFNTQQDVDMLYKVMLNELALTTEQGDKVHELLNGSLKSQEVSRAAEVAKTNPSFLESIYQRQEMHVEGNLKQIITAEQYTKYQTIKPQLLAKVKALMTKGKK